MHSTYQHGFCVDSRNDVLCGYQTSEGVEASDVDVVCAVNMVPRQIEKRGNHFFFRVVFFRGVNLQREQVGNSEFRALEDIRNNEWGSDFELLLAFPQ